MPRLTEVGEPHADGFRELLEANQLQLVGKLVLASVKATQLPSQIVVVDAVKLDTGANVVVVIKVKLSTCVQSPKPPPVSGAYITVQLPAGGLGDWTQVDNFTFITTTTLPPVSNFTASTTTICQGNCIAFTDASTNSPTSWSWSFPGGTPATSTTQNPSSVCYAAAGTYAVTLTATNASGSNTLTQTSYITVNPIDVATFNYSASSYCQAGTNPTPTITGTTGGTFTSTGAQTVILVGSGTPVSSGNQTFTVTFGASTCTFVVNFIAGAAPATGTLGGAPGSCTSATSAGTYTQGIALTSSNTLTVQVNVTAIGAYTISTNTVNGVSFTKTGTFTTTGIQTVILTGTGTPTNSGSQTFAVTFGASTCNFSITFAPGTPVTDYFPTTVNSYWAYGLQGGTPADSFMIKVIPATKAISGNTYTVFTLDDIPPSGSPDSLFYRKGAGLYYENFNTEAFFGFDAGTGGNVEYIFLKDNVAQGTTWQSPNMTGSSGGTSYTIYIKMTLFEKATTPITSGVVTSSDVLKVRYEYFVTAAPGTPFFTEERWFAKNIGLIYNSFNDGTKTQIYNVWRYQVF